MKFFFILISHIAAATAKYTGQFRRDLKDGDALHRGEGVVSIGAKSIGLVGALAPGPIYKLYLSREFVEAEAEFERLEPGMVRVADMKTFKNFMVTVPDGIDVGSYNTVITWCERFSEFITAAKFEIQVGAGALGVMCKQQVNAATRYRVDAMGKFITQEA